MKKTLAVTVTRSGRAITPQNKDVLKAVFGGNSGALSIKEFAKRYGVS